MLITTRQWSSEANVFSHVSLSFCLSVHRRVPMWPPHRPVETCLACPHSPPPKCSKLPHNTGTPWPRPQPPDMFKLVMWPVMLASGRLAFDWMPSCFTIKFYSCGYRTGPVNCQYQEGAPTYYLAKFRRKLKKIGLGAHVQNFTMYIRLWPSRGQQVSHQRWIWRIHCIQATKGSTLALKPRANVTEVQNGSISGLTKKADVLQKL